MQIAILGPENFLGPGNVIRSNCEVVMFAMCDSKGVSIHQAELTAWFRSFQIH